MKQEETDALAREMLGKIADKWTLSVIEVLARTSHKPSIRSKDRERCKRIGA
jgi:DNA-binding HxlR family transcriptional regulator